MDENLKQRLVELAQKYEVHDFILQDPSQFLFWYDDFPDLETENSLSLKFVKSLIFL